MPEPQSTAFFLLMLAVFGALMWWLAVARQLVFRILAACLAFLPAMMFGVAAVNKYYDYYQNWSSAISDLTGSSGQSIQLPDTTAGGGPAKLGTVLGSNIDSALAQQSGYTLSLTVHGTLSHLNRTVYVYLPPDYFRPGFRNYRFPVIELIHGFPGQPQDWITLMGANTIMNSLVAAHRADPAVLVMPDANGGRGISLQCLNQVNGPQDETFLAKDLPNYIAKVLRVQPPSKAWGIAGYSEGGYCAANLGLQFGGRYGYVGVLSGYFKPFPDQLGNPPRVVSPFGKNAALRRRNSPVDLVSSLPPGAPVPQFWLGTGAADRSDTKNAAIFAQLVATRQPGVIVKVVPGGGHNMFTWRKLLAPMLEWMTPRLALVGQQAQGHRALQAHNRATNPPKAGHLPSPGKSRVPAAPRPSATTPPKKHQRGR